MSTPRTRSERLLRPSNSITVNPIGFGRRGDRVAKTPCGRLSEGGMPSSSKPSARSNSQRTIKCEKPSISVRPGANSGRIFRMPSASCFAPRPLGTSVVLLNGLVTKPIGREVNMADPQGLIPQLFRHAYRSNSRPARFATAKASTLSPPAGILNIRIANKRFCGGVDGKHCRNFSLDHNGRAGGERTREPGHALGRVYRAEQRCAAEFGYAHRG